MTKHNFSINSSHPISKQFLNREIKTFKDACVFIKNLPYGRNKNKVDLTTVFSDNRGTCSTKHALLKQLAIENGANNIQLKIGVFKMSKKNTPEVGNTLAKYNLEYIPEAHNYLMAEGEIIDCTRKNSSENDFVEDLLNEIEIEPNQITDFKVNHHQSFLKNWLVQNPDIKINFDDLWLIREKCIADLSTEINSKH